MIYLDNAATTIRKPECVIQAVTEALCSFGNAGRGATTESLDAARTIFETRERLCEIFHGEDPSCIAFTSNSTESLNIAIKGLIEKGNHVITTQLEHNSVLRPLYECERAGVELTIVPCNSHGILEEDQVESYIKENTKAIVCTHGSNLTGNIVDIKKIGEIAKKHDVLLIVDASQTAGVFPIDVQAFQIDVLCFTGHKSLLGPQGVGGIYVKPGVEINPLMTGGSGVDTYNKNHPNQMPTRLEAGTLNGHGIAGLHAALGYIKETTPEVILKKEQQLMKQFYEGVRELTNITVYGDFESDYRCPIVLLNIGDYDSAEVSDELLMTYGIATRPGAHCAPLMHEALGTVEQGGVRFSFSYYNTEEEVEKAIQAIEELSREV